MNHNQYLASYLKATYPTGRIRTARRNHRCNGWENDPGCNGEIETGDSFFDTGCRDRHHRAGRFCNRCAMIGPAAPDLFSSLSADNPSSQRKE
jgi:hypothetical protein